MASDNDLVLLLEQFRNDISFFAQQAFGTTLNPKQVEFVAKYQRNSQIRSEAASASAKRSVWQC